MTKKNTYSTFYMVLALIPLVFFNNCTQYHFKEETTEPSNGPTLNGNAQGYDGKLELHVNSTGNGHDQAPGDGVCNSALGICTLRAAIEESNAQILPVLIRVPDGIYDLERDGEFSVTNSLTLIGTSQSKTIIQANASAPSRVFNVTANNMIFESLTIRNGKSSLSGAGIFYNNVNGTLALLSVGVLNNASSSTEGAGGVYANAVSVDIQNSLIKGNAIKSTTGATDDGAGGVYLQRIGTSILATIINSTFDGNTGNIFSGGATVWGHLTLKNNIFSNNSSVYKNGGALNVLGSGIVDSCTFTGNSTAFFDGGAIFRGATIGGPFTISNSTFYNNAAGGTGRGGAIGNFGPPGPSNGMSIEYSTFSSNSAGSGGAIFAYTGTQINVTASIFSANSGQNCGAQPQGLISSLGFNIDSDNSCGFTGPGDLVNIDPLLIPGPPVNNGGSTPTIALQNTSPALNAIPTSGFYCPLVDQRGSPRPSGGACDIGAYEK